MTLQKHKTAKSTKIRQSARGEDCTVRIPSICNGNPETVVLAHCNGGGAGMKAPDFEAAYCCSACHDEIDRRTRNTEFEHALLYHLKGCMETRQKLFDKGLLKVA